MARINDDITYPILGSLGGTARIVIYDPLSGDGLNKVLPATLEASLLLNNISGVVDVAQGGTGNVTKQLGFDALSPTVSAGDIIVHDGTNNIPLAVGFDSFIIQANSSNPNKIEWVKNSNSVFAQTASVTVANTVTESTLVGAGVGTLTLPANSLAVGESGTVSITGSIETNGAGQTIRIKAGSILDSGVLTLESVATPSIFHIDMIFTVRTVGIATVASVSSSGSITYIASAGGGALEGAFFSQIEGTVFDTTIPNTLDVNVTWGLASPSNSITCDNLVFSRI